jgi:imidazolonepropionase-like amidohydrolase
VGIDDSDGKISMTSAPHGLLITGAQVLAPDCSSFLRRDIRIEGTVIRDMSEKLVAGPGDRVVDAAGLWVLPGLIDAHVHTIGVEDDLRALHRQPPYLVMAKSARLLGEMLARGFTSVRDAGGAEGGLAVAIETGLFDGPRLFPAGRGLAPPGGQGDFRAPGEETLGCICCGGKRSITRLASGIDGLRAAVREEIAAGATQIKMMASGGVASPAGPEHPQYSDAELQSVVDEAASAGSYVMAHAYGAEAIRRCLAAGIHSIEHGSGLDERTAALMARRGAVLVPTLIVFERLSRLQGPVAETARRIFDESCASIEIAQRHGVLIGHGSDLEGSEHVHQSGEFALKASVMKTSDVIASATLVNARLVKTSHPLGVLSPGAVADLLMVDTNPLETITALAKPERHVVRVIKDGAVMVERKQP